MEDKTMLVRSGVVQYGICEADVKVTMPIYCRHNMLFTQSIEKDEQMLREQAAQQQQQYYLRTQQTRMLHG